MTQAALILNESLKAFGDMVKNVPIRILTYLAVSR